MSETNLDYKIQIIFPHENLISLGMSGICLVQILKNYFWNQLKYFLLEIDNRICFEINWITFRWELRRSWRLFPSESKPESVERVRMLSIVVIWIMIIIIIIIIIVVIRIMILIIIIVIRIIINIIWLVIISSWWEEFFHFWLYVFPLSKKPFLPTRLEICQKNYTTEFSGKKFYTLKVHKLQLFLLKRNSQKASISAILVFFVRI